MEMTKLELAKAVVGDYRIENEWFHCIFDDCKGWDPGAMENYVFFEEDGISIGDCSHGEYNVFCIQGLSDEEFEQLTKWSYAVDAAMDEALKSALNH